MTLLYKAVVGKQKNLLTQALEDGFPCEKYSSPCHTDWRRGDSKESQEREEVRDTTGVRACCSQGLQGNRFNTGHTIYRIIL